jgi:nucleotide-binding universal stress UspA family protein
MAIEKILVPLDGSDLAEAALETAIDLVSEKPTTMLVLLRAAEEQLHDLREAESYLNGVAAGLRECGITRVKTAVSSGPAAPTIVEAAVAEEVDLIVMCSRGRGGPGRLLFGSVAESVLHGARTPILLVRDISAPVPPLQSPAKVGSTGETNAAVSPS